MECRSCRSQMLFIGVCRQRHARGYACGNCAAYCIVYVDGRAVWGPALTLDSSAYELDGKIWNKVEELQRRRR